MITTADIEFAAARLRSGGLVAFPTETVYGLGGDATSDATVAAIYATKGRPSFNPLIVHVASLEDAKKYVSFNDTALALAQQYWPGPLTLVLPRRADCTLSLLVSAGLDSVAIRIPAHTLAHALLTAASLPLAAPSANRSGRISPTLAEHVCEELPDIFVLDGGPCAVGIESTVVDVTGSVPVILRPGSITADMLSAFAVTTPDTHMAGAPRAPGMLESHYAPNKPLRLNITQPREGEALLAFGSFPISSPIRGEAGRGAQLVMTEQASPHPNPPPNGEGIIANLSPSGNLQQAAANLFKMLRTLDASDAHSIAVMPIPEEGLGIAINDRLKRAAAPRA